MRLNMYLFLKEEVVELTFPTSHRIIASTHNVLKYESEGGIEENYRDD